MNYFFEKEIQRRFSTLSSHQRYSVYNLAKRPENCASLTPVDQQQLTQVVHRLILVTTTSATEQTVDEQQQQLVSGLEVYEYTTRSSNGNAKRTIYISKIDTTGSTLARGVTRRLVQAYVVTQQHVGQCSIHVFARAQPQYLFPHSANDTSKRVLTDRQLVAWWRTTLSDKDLYSCSDGNKVTPFWIVPGVDEQGALYDIGQKRLVAGNSIEWRYGYPYAGKALAKNVIPRFEDDGKARYLGTLLESNNGDDDDEQQRLTVDDFWTLFGYSEECGAGKLTAIFVIEISTTPTTTTTTTTAPAIPASLKDDDYTQLWNSLMGLDFHDDQANLKSTKTWLEMWLDIVLPRSFTVTSNNHRSTGSGLVATATTTKDEDVTQRPIQTLAVKRKPTSSPAQEPLGNNITTTITSNSNNSAVTNSPSTTTATVNVLVPKRRKKEN